MPCDLNPEQQLALIQETASIRYVLDSGDRLLRAPGPLERERDAIFACTSIGVEKLAKVALCLIEIAEGRPWPAVSELNKSSRGWGHASAAMDTRLRDGLSSRVEGLEHEDLLKRMLCTVEQDQVWRHVVRTFEAYSTNGRFYHLDALAMAPLNEDRDPTTHWERAERAAISRSQTLRDLSEEDWDAFEAELLATVADSIRRWWSLVALAGMHGALGACGVSFGADVLPDNAVPFNFDSTCK